MTRIVDIEQVIATHRHDWKKWPDTDDRDYGPVLAERWTSSFRRDDTIIRVHNRFYPVYSAYVRAGDETLPIRFPVINNLSPPGPAVLEQQRRDLRLVAQECKAILWEHAHQCFPEVVFEMPSLFSLRALSHGDDCPGSSDVKTFPVASYFNALIYSMYVWNNESGALTADEYARRGLGYARFCPNVMSAGLQAGLDEVGFSIDKKQAMMRAGECDPTLAFVGFTGGGERAQMFRHLGAAHARQQQLGLSIRLHGIGMPDGPLEPRDPPHPRGLGYPMAALYSNAFASPNMAISSLFNCRLADLWFAGVVQLVRDRWGELGRMGFVDGEHYLGFDGTADSLLAQLERIRARPTEAAALVGRAYAQAMQFWRANSWEAAYTDIYFRYVDGLLT